MLRSAFMMWKPKSAKALKTPDEMICCICTEEVGTKRTDGTIEISHTLPCGHVFGSSCILLWLERSYKKDCPNCRRRMIHPGCGHLIMPHNSTTAPPIISASETPTLCVRCRGEGVVALALRTEHDRLQLQVEALEGVRKFLPKFFGTQTVEAVSSTESRIAELRKGFAVFQEKAWGRSDERERRRQW